MTATPAPPRPQRLNPLGSAPPITWAETRARLAADRQRLIAFLDAEPGRRPRALALSPSYQAVLLHRLSYYCWSHHRTWLARLLWHVNLLLTGLDVGVLSDVGGGLVVNYPAAVGICGRIGRNCTFYGFGGVGGGTRRRDDIGGGPGLPVICDDVCIESGALVVGPIRVGDRVTIGPGCVVSQHVPDDTVFEAATRFVLGASRSAGAAAGSVS